MSAAGDGSTEPHIDRFESRLLLHQIVICGRLSVEVRRMHKNHLWNRAKQVQIQTSPDIVGGFDIGFDRNIPEETKDALMRFVYWVEDRFCLPVTLWVDFKYNHYLIARNGNRVGYRFYWADFVNYPAFTNPDDIPVIELPVRTERWTIEEILASFIEAISQYYAWLTNTIADSAVPDKNAVEAVLQAYLQDCSAETDMR